MATSRDPFHALLTLVRKKAVYEKLNIARETFECISNRMGMPGVLDSPQELVAFLGQHLKPKELEKKENGEVFTPPDLIQQKFDRLTLADPQIWSDPSKKFLDPANGIGNYPALAFHRLMKGLKDVIPNEVDRKKHILENMLYMCELNKKNIEVSRRVFDPENVYALNLVQGSYLDLDPTKEWGVQKFDVIFGNPPYQEKVGPRKTSTLWDKFVKKSLDILQENGYAVFVHPSGWRNVDGKFKYIQKVLFANNLIYLEIHNEADGIVTFKSETRYDWYIVQKRAYMNTTLIRFQDTVTRSVSLNGIEFIPNANYDRIYSLMAFGNEPKVNVLHDYSSYETRKKWMSKTKTVTCVHPCVYTVNSQSEVKAFYSSEQRGHFGVPKFIWSNGRISSIGSYVDTHGMYGLTQFAYAIIDEPKHLHLIKKVFDSREFKKLMEDCAVGQLTVNYKAVALFKKEFWKIFDLPRATEPEAVQVTVAIQPEYKKMKVAQLKELCKDRKIGGITGKSKEQLIGMLTVPSV
jgi:SAM-dependent methyltransferase